MHVAFFFIKFLIIFALILLFLVEEIKIFLESLIDDGKLIFLIN